MSRARQTPKRLKPRGRELGSHRPEDEQSVRCLKVTDFAYWRGSASLTELTAACVGLRGAGDVNPSVLEQDIALLVRQGLPFHTTGDGRYQINAALPGFGLRLRKYEASALWAWCVAHRPVVGAPKREPPDASAADAIGVLEEGLRGFHSGAEVIDNAGSMLSGSEGLQPAGAVRATDVHGEARLVYRRLRIVDLIERRTAVDIQQVAAALDVSYRTVHADLAMLREVGIDIQYVRGKHEYVVGGLNHYLSEHLTLPMAAALLAFLSPTNTTEASCAPSHVFQSASRKVTESIRLMFHSQEESLETLLHA